MPGPPAGAAERRSFSWKSRLSSCGGARHCYVIATPLNDPFSDGLAILVVEDDNALRDSVHDYLVMDGYAVESVATVDEAAECLDQHRPAVLVLDLMLADGRAEPLLAKLKARGDAAPVTVLVSAALDAHEIAKRYDVPLLPKPFDLEELSEMVAELVARRSSVPVAV